MSTRRDRAGCDETAGSGGSGALNQGGIEMAKGLIYEMAEQRKDSLIYRTEKTILNLNERICSLMEEKQISRSELAERLKTSKAYITKILNGQPNMTITTLEKIAVALGVELNIDLQSPVQERAKSRIISSPEQKDKEVWKKEFDETPIGESEKKRSCFRRQVSCKEEEKIESLPDFKKRRILKDSIFEHCLTLEGGEYGEISTCKVAVG